MWILGFDMNFRIGVNFGPEFDFGLPKMSPVCSTNNVSGHKLRANPMDQPGKARNNYGPVGPKIQLCRAFSGLGRAGWSEYTPIPILYRLTCGWFQLSKLDSQLKI